jgi:TonB family protein
MLTVLLESKARRQRRRGGAALSLAMHVAIIGLVAAATARGTTQARAEHPPMEQVRFTRPLEPLPTARHAPTPVRFSRALALTAPTLLVPTIVPTTLPPIELGRPIDARDFATGARSGLGEAVDYRVAAPDNDDRSWSGTETLMHVVTAARPRYPEALRTVGVSGRVLVRFRVDTLGRVDMTSLEVLTSSHDLFTRAVREALPGFRFVPAMSGGKKVEALGEMPFDFRLLP